MHDEDFFSDHDPALAFLDWNFATGRLSKRSSIGPPELQNTPAP
jgi:hypothetical protein